MLSRSAPLLDSWLFGWREGRDTTLGRPQGPRAGSILSPLHLCRLSSPPPGGGPWARPDLGSAVRRQICLIFSFEGNWLNQRWKGSAPSDEGKQKQVSIVSIFPEKNQRIKPMQVRGKEWEKEREGGMGEGGRKRNRGRVEGERGRKGERKTEISRSPQDSPRPSASLLWCTHTVEKYKYHSTLNDSSRTELPNFNVNTSHLGILCKMQILIQEAGGGTCNSAFLPRCRYYWYSVPWGTDSRARWLSWTGKTFSNHNLQNTACFKTIPIDRWRNRL